MGRNRRHQLPKVYREVIGEALSKGCEVDRTRSDHYRITLPNGRKVFTSGTPSCSRTVKNLRANLRRSGLRI